MKKVTMKIGSFNKTIDTGWMEELSNLRVKVSQLSIVQGWNKNGAVKTCNDCLRQFPNVNNNYSDPWGGALHTSSTIHGDMNTDIFYVHNQSKQISFFVYVFFLSYPPLILSKEIIYDLNFSIKSKNHHILVILTFVDLGLRLRRLVYLFLQYAPTKIYIFNW